MEHFAPVVIQVDELKIGDKSDTDMVCRSHLDASARCQRQVGLAAGARRRESRTNGAGVPGERCRTDQELPEPSGRLAVGRAEPQTGLVRIQPEVGVPD